MFTAQFSEFSYGYAMTDNILHSGLPHSPHSPVFPSLFAEGTSGGGYDVKIPLRPVPIFLQFKIPQVVRRRSDQMPPGFAVPYLRMHLRTKRPNQHQLLLDLEARGKLVYYVVPDFWTTRTLDRHFIEQRVPARSWYISPSRIGPLDSDPHYVAYRLGNDTAWRHSKPHLLNGQFGAENFAKDLDHAVATAERQEPLSFFQRTAREILELTKREEPILESISEDEGIAPEADVLKPTTEKRAVEKSEGPQKSKRPPTTMKSREDSLRPVIVAAREVAYIAQVRLGCSFLITGAD
jgi:hypothetical protein